MAGAPLLPRWLQLTAESRTSSQITHYQQCPEQTVRKETCYVEQVDGISLLRCEELIERFRLCADGHREMVESTTKTHIRPYSSDPSSSSSSRYDDVIESVAPLVSSSLGQMLDEFFEYATELQQSLEEQGVHCGQVDSSSSSNRSSSPSRWRFPGTVKAEAASRPESSSKGGLFGWWMRKKAAKTAAGDQQPSLQQLVRESSSHTQEI